MVVIQMENGMKIFKEITNSDIYEKLESIERLAARQNVHIKVQYGIMSILGTFIFYIVYLHLGK
jgi:hypothetical protein